MHAALCKLGIQNFIALVAKGISIDTDLRPHRDRASVQHAKGYLPKLCPAYHLHIRPNSLALDRMVKTAGGIKALKFSLFIQI